MIRDYPFTGIGLDTFRLVAQNEYPYFNYAFNQTEHPHNIFLQAGVDGGVLGLLALLWLIVAFYRTVGKSKIQSSKFKVQALWDFAGPQCRTPQLVGGAVRQTPTSWGLQPAIHANSQIPNIQYPIPGKSQYQSLITGH